ncbi:MAG: hypothetical protein K2W82_18070 [Candidatus Obscuribacterales bacterium]|nr:hypothetical protein [Candidatus Obscuribacterales bacterium]
MQIGKLSTFVFFVFALCSASAVFAETPRPELRQEEVAADANQNEVSHTKSKLGDTLIQEVIRYKDNSAKVIGYRPDGTVQAITNQSSDGKTSTVTDYAEDGKRKLKTTVSAEGREEPVSKTVYKADGSYVVSTYGERGDGDDANFYYSAEDKPVLQIANEGHMTVYTVYDKNGKQDYKQRWVSGFGGPVLLMVEEVTASGAHRRIYLTGGVKKVEYLKADGSVDHSESVNKGSLELAEPINPKHEERVKLPQ